MISANRQADRQMRMGFRRLALLLLCTGLTLFAGCSDDDSSPNGPSQVSSYLRATVDGTSYEASWSAYAVWVNDPMPALTLVGMGPMGTDSCLINISLDTNDTGTYSLAPSSTDRLATVELRQARQYLATVWGDGHGSLVISNNTNARITGRFEFVAYVALGSDSVVVTDGSFDVPMNVP